MRILILNWRCLNHPKAGGAELVTQRIAAQLAAWGHRVTLFTASFPGALQEEELEGVRIIRRGGQISVHWEAALWYRQQGDAPFDVVVDEINTLPFFAPWYAGVPVLGFIPQLAREVWWYEAPQPLAMLGYWLEPWYLRAYRDIPFATVSQSTTDDLVRLGHRAPRHVIPVAIDLKPLESLAAADKEPHPTLLCLGRLVPSKRVDHAIEALARLHQQGLPARLWVVGEGEAREKQRLQRLVEARHLQESVRFWDAVSSEQKATLLRRAHLLLACSVREGWGLMVTEANAMGTPAVVYDAPGLRDSTRHGETGIVCAENSPASMAEAVRELLADPGRYGRMREGAWEWSKDFAWEKTARAFAAALPTGPASGMMASNG